MPIPEKTLLNKKSRKFQEDLKVERGLKKDNNNTNKVMTLTVIHSSFEMILNLASTARIKS